MAFRRAAVPICLLALSPGLAAGQSADAAAERARLANERIQAEAQRRAQEELALQGRAPVQTGIDATPQAPLTAQPAAAPPVDPTVTVSSAGPGRPQSPPPAAPAAGTAPPAPPRDPPLDDERTRRALEQLRELGALKDAGYLTDEEFQRIKQRILESHF